MLERELFLAKARALQDTAKVMTQSGFDRASIADIFYNNCFENGILPISLPEEEIRRLFRLTSDASTASISVDLFDQII